MVRKCKPSVPKHLACPWLASSRGFEVHHGTLPSLLHEPFRVLMILEWVIWKLSDRSGSPKSLKLELVFYLHHPLAIPVPHPRPHPVDRMHSLHIPRDGRFSDLQDLGFILEQASYDQSTGCKYSPEGIKCDYVRAEIGFPYFEVILEFRRGFYTVEKTRKILGCLGLRVPGRTLVELVPIMNLVRC